SAPDVSRGAGPGRPSRFLCAAPSGPSPSFCSAAGRSQGGGEGPACARPSPAVLRTGASAVPRGARGTDGGSGNRLPVSGPSFRAPPSRSVPGGLQAEADLQPHLVVGDLPVLQVAAHLGDLEPVQSAQRLACPGH